VWRDRADAQVRAFTACSKLSASASAELDSPEHVAQPGSRAEDRHNRIHLDLRAPGPIVDEVAHLTEPGAVVLQVERTSP
jgi:hypothetical protein